MKAPRDYLKTGEMSGGFRDQVEVGVVLEVSKVGRAGPALGVITKDRDLIRRIALGFMAWWIVRPPSDFALMLNSIEWYRGHTKGFEFNYLEAIAIGLALNALLEKREDFKWLPPALAFWLLWVVVSCFSVVKAIEPSYVFMPAFKFAKMGFVFLGVLRRSVTSGTSKR